MKRVQRKRIKGWKMPVNTVYVGRPTKWGNPFKIDAYNSSKDALRRYQFWLKERLKDNPHFLDELKGKDLACWCRLDQPCHADVLLRNLYVVDVHDVEKWLWIECPRCRFGQRANPELLKKGKFTCPDCKIEMKVMHEPRD